MNVLSRMVFSVSSLAVGFIFSACAFSPTKPAPAAAERVLTPTEDSGANPIPEQAAYDVQHCELDLQIFPTTERIAGTARIGALVLAPLEWFVLDLDPLLPVSAVRIRIGEAAAVSVRFERRGPRLWIALGKRFEPGTRFVADIDYAGKPRRAVRAPWDGGFTWAKTKSGQPWIATACETEGADLWWPCKDQPGDKPESFTLRIRVPEPLVVASNGRLVEMIPHDDHTRTYHWETRYPISNYNIALNIAPYETITGTSRVSPATRCRSLTGCSQRTRRLGRRFFPNSSST